MPPEKEMMVGSAASAMSRRISDERIPCALFEKPATMFSPFTTHHLANRKIAVKPY
jgi:hypothetical protein